MTDKTPNFKLEVEELEGGGYMFKLSEDIEMFFHWHSETQIMALMQRERDNTLDFAPPETLNPAKSQDRQKLAEMAASIFFSGGDKAEGEKLSKRLAEEIDDCSIWFVTPDTQGKTPREKLKDIGQRSVAVRLIAYARKSAELFHDSERRCYATCRVQDADGIHLETYEIGSSGFEMWFRGEYWQREADRIADLEASQYGALYAGGAMLPDVIRDQQFSDAISQLRALANFEGKERRVFVRVGTDGGSKVYIDLADERWQVVEITEDGWRRLGGEDVPVRFVRPAGLLPLPEPVEGEKPDKLRKLLNLPPTPEGDSNWVLLLVWLTHALLPLERSGPYSILTLLGPPGSAKTTAGEIIRTLIDPFKVLSCGRIREEQDLFVAADAQHCLFYNNLSSLPKWTSDLLCNVSEGGGFSTRRLYANRDLENFEGGRPILLTSIGDVLGQPDILDRATIIRLERLTKKQIKKKTKVKKEAEEARPQILGFLFDAIKSGLAKIDRIEPGELTRMADYEAWGAAVEEGLGFDAGTFQKAYSGSRGDAANTALESDALSIIIYKFAKNYQASEPWEGTTTNLLKGIEREASDEEKRRKEWPGRASDLGQRLGMLAHALTEMGIVVEKLGHSNDGTRWRVYYAPAPQGDGGDSKGDGAVTDPVTGESSIDKPKTGGSDRGDSGDSKNHNPLDEEDFGEL